jgi:serine/threonine protein kinase
VVQHIGVEALKALDYAHSKRDHDGLPLKLVHRDVSPENIMVTQRGEVQLLDFGVLKSDDRRRGTDPGQLQGNLAFMAPEQARGQDVDARADLFALGLVLYFALTAEPLYGTDTGYDLLLKAASGPDRPKWPSCQRCRRRSPRCCTGRWLSDRKRASPTPSASPRRCRPPARTRPPAWRRS